MTIFVSGYFYLDAMNSLVVYFVVSGCYSPEFG